MAERKARAATRNQAWGPTGSEMAVLAELTHQPTGACRTLVRAAAALQMPLMPLRRPC